MKNILKQDNKAGIHLSNRKKIEKKAFFKLCLKKYNLAMLKQQGSVMIHVLRFKNEQSF